MLIVEGLREANFFPYIGNLLLSRTSSKRGLSLVLVFLCFVSSMFITNDVALITFVPFGILILEMAGMESRICYLIVLMTIAANWEVCSPRSEIRRIFICTLLPA